jgi:hypothetical protein
MKRTFVNAFIQASGSGKQFIKASDWLVKEVVVKTIDKNGFELLTPETTAAIIQDFSIVMAMGAKLKRTEYLIVGTALGATGMYIYMKYKNRKNKK